MTLHNSQDTEHHRFYSADGREFILAGTAHVSRQSAEMVTALVAEEKPDTVCVELCEQRYQAIRDKNKWREMDIFKVIKEKKAFLLLANLLLASFQKKIAEKFGVQPGQDMIAALDAAELNGAAIHLVDREIRTTLARAWKAIGLWGKIKLMFQMVISILGANDIEEEEIEQLKQEDVLKMLLSELEKSHPMLQKILIDERDRYLAHKIKNAPGNKILAVVGAGHIPGIRRYWDETFDITELDALPPSGKMRNVLKWGIPGAIIAAFAGGFVFGGVDTGTRMLGLWIIVNSVMAGVGAIAAWAHPLTILSAAASAPLTSVSPVIGAGWIAGLVEALIRKPTVGDLEDLSQDIASLKGFWKNRATRILLVVALVNLGSAAGTFAAIPLIIRLLGA
ncbi:MAG: TraB/GumN family protein [Thermodesulfobacteriota bacterium]|nr:TraB/GumN family protein [Thermodesulfobacteriota bacterium]